MRFFVRLLPAHFWGGLSHVTHRAVMALLCVVAICFAGVTPAQAHDDMPTPGSVTLTLTNLQPAYVSGDQPVSVSVVIHNGSREPISGAELRVFVQTSAFISRSELAQWPTVPASTRLGTLLHSEDLAATIPAGGELAMTAVIDSVSLRGWGAHGLTIGLDSKDTGEWYAQVRSFLMSNPRNSVEATPLSVVVPLINDDPTGTAALTALDQSITLPTDAMRAAAERGATSLTSGRLANVLAVAQLPHVTWTLDPTLLADSQLGEKDPIADAAAGPTAPSASDAPTSSATSPRTTPAPNAATATTSTPTSGPASAPPAASATPDASTTTQPAQPATPTATAPAVPALPTVTRTAVRAFNAELLNDAKNRDVYAGEFSALPLRVLRGGAGEGLWETVNSWQNSIKTEFSGVTWRGTLGSLTRNQVSADALEQWQNAGASALLLPSESVPLKESLTYTAEGVTDVEVAGESLPTALTDAVLSQQLVELESQSRVATAQQRILAELAVISAELPGTPRSIVIAAPRNWNPSGVAAQAAMSRVLTAPWVRPQGLAAALSQVRADAERDVPRAVRARADGYYENMPAATFQAPTDALQRAATQISVLAGMKSVMQTDASVTPLQRLALGAVSSAAVVGAGAVSATAPEINNANRALAAAATKDVSGGIVITAPPQVNFVAATGNIPLTIKNTLRVPVKFKVVLQPELPLLRSDDSFEAVLASGQTKSTNLPVKALTNGDSSVSLQVVNAAGVTVVSPGVFTVSVRAQWEGILAYVLGLLIVALLALGTYQRLKQRKMKQLESQ